MGFTRRPASGGYEAMGVSPNNDVEKGILSQPKPTMWTYLVGGSALMVAAIVGGCVGGAVVFFVVAAKSCNETTTMLSPTDSTLKHSIIHFNSTVSPSGVPSVSPSASSSRDDDKWVVREGKDYVYVLNRDLRNWAGHEIHRAPKCGGHLASITSERERLLTEDLIQTNLPSQQRHRIWLGGVLNFTVDPPAWQWRDGSPWTFAHWATGQKLVEGSLPKHHHVFRGNDGRWRDENGFSTTLKVPGIYLLPLDYTNATKYPECDTHLISENSISADVWRNGKRHIYVMNDDYRNWAGHEIHRAPKCGGHLASITNETEGDVVENLIRTTLGNRFVEGVWLGGVFAAQEEKGGPLFSSWEWCDNSNWTFRHWGMGEPKTDHHHLLRVDPNGLWKDEDGFSTVVKVPGLYLLPLDFDDARKYPECDTNSFAY